VRRRVVAASIAVLLAAWPALAGVDEVKLRLPLKPKLPLRGNERIALAPFIVVTDAEKARDKRLANVDLQGEFHRFLKKQLEKKTKFEIIQTPPDVKLPTQSLTELGRAQEFWASPIDGRTYYRQVYVEQTGFMFDIVLLVFDGRTGEKLLQDQFKDFRQTSSRRADELQGLFENLFSLESQILNTFVARDREAERYIFTN
jgi:hypothetical protein